MQYKMLSTYSITRNDRTIEIVNAASMEEALKSLPISEKELPVAAILLQSEGPVKTLIADAPTEVDLNVYSAPQEAIGCKATPASAILHVGDDVLLEAIPGFGYTFEGWKLDGKTISTDRKFMLKIPEIENPQHYNRLNVLAEFRQKDVDWTCQVVPPEAAEVGCIAGPGKGSGPANAPIELIACPEGNYKFDGWFRQDQELAKLKKLETVVRPLAPDEEKAVYEARFSLQE